jgi:SPP1 gp7 family putative phage head morphogenesis protein
LLRYQLAMRQLVGAFAQAVRSAVLPALERFVVGGGNAEAVVAGARARLRGEPAKVGVAAQVVAERTVDHSKTEFRRLGIKLRPLEVKNDRKGKERLVGVRLRDAEPKLDKLITGWRKENVDKITSLVGKELDTIEGLLRDGEGRRVESLAKEIEGRFDVTRSKAELLARDQVLKLNANITGERQKAAGIEEYIWTSSGDERVRERHGELDGQTFRWDDPPVTNEAGDKNHPGEDYQCRCTAYPVLPELEDDDAGSSDEPTSAPESEPTPASGERPLGVERENEPVPLDLAEPKPEVAGELPAKQAFHEWHPDVFKFAARQPAIADHYLDRSRYSDRAFRSDGESLLGIRDYTAGGYDQLNRTLRAGGELGPELKRMHDGVSQGLARARASGSTISGTFYRGINLETPEHIDAFFREVQEGRVWMNRDFLSTSAAEEIADKFAGSGPGRVMLEIEAASGVPLGNVSSFQASEAEVLFDRQRRFIVQSVTDDPAGGRRIKLREVR